MSGKELKDKLEATGISKATIAEKLGITPQHLNQQLNVDDVKSGFLERVCTLLKALNPFNPVFSVLIGLVIFYYCLVFHHLLRHFLYHFFSRFLFLLLFFLFI